MPLHAILYLNKGLIEKVWVTDDPDLLEQWIDQLEREFGIERDEAGELVDDTWEHQVLSMDVDEYNLTFNMNNQIQVN